MGQIKTTTTTRVTNSRQIFADGTIRLDINLFFKLSSILFNKMLDELLLAIDYLPKHILQSLDLKFVPQ